MKFSAKKCNANDFESRKKQKRAENFNFRARQSEKYLIKNQYGFTPAASARKEDFLRP